MVCIERWVLRHRVARAVIAPRSLRAPKAPTSRVRVRVRVRAWQACAIICWESAQHTFSDPSCACAGHEEGEHVQGMQACRGETDGWGAPRKQIACLWLPETSDSDMS